MATAKVKHFYDGAEGSIELTGLTYMLNEEFAKRFPGVKGRRSDSFSKLVAFHGGEMLPVTRVIEFKKNPSLHKCDARCQHAKGVACECSCGGKNHGAAS